MTKSEPFSFFGGLGGFLSYFCGEKMKESPPKIKVFEKGSGAKLFSKSFAPALINNYNGAGGLCFLRPPLLLSERSGDSNAFNK